MGLRKSTKLYVLASTPAKDLSTNGEIEQTLNLFFTSSTVKLENFQTRVNKDSGRALNSWCADLNVDKFTPYDARQANNFYPGEQAPPEDFKKLKNLRTVRSNNPLTVELSPEFITYAALCGTCYGTGRCACEFSVGKGKGKGAGKGSGSGVKTAQQAAKERAAKRARLANEAA